MPRVYKTKEGAKKRDKINITKLKSAVYDVVYAEKSIRGTAKNYNISVMTLKRYVRKKRDALAAGSSSPEYEPNYRQSQIFSKKEEEDLSNYYIRASKMHYGLTPKAARELAYEFAVKNNKKIPQNWQDYKIASYEWLHGFMNRHGDLSLRIPEATSLSRATSFNRHNVSQFFSKLKSLYNRYHFEARDVWNVDETGLTTVHKPKKIIASKGLKQVSKVTSAERGELVTVCVAINAAGNHIPPFLIFPRKNWQPRMLDKAPAGSDGAPYPSGWMTVPNFVRFLEHFKKNVRCSKDNQCLVIFDNHESHISVDAINYAKDNGIHLLTIPPHTSQKLQPLDRIVFSVLKTYYNTACDDWMLSNPARTLSIYEIAGCLGRAYPNAMTPRNIIKSFEICGIHPFNSDIFTDDEFLSSFVTDRQKETITHSLEESVSEIPAAASSGNISEIPAESVTHLQEEPVTDASGGEDLAGDDLQQSSSSGRVTPSLLDEANFSCNIANEHNNILVADSIGSTSAAFSCPTFVQLASQSVFESCVPGKESSVTASTTPCRNTPSIFAPFSDGVAVKTAACLMSLTSVQPHGDVTSAQQTSTAILTDFPENDISESASTPVTTTSPRVPLSTVYTTPINQNFRTPSKSPKMCNTPLHSSLSEPSVSKYISPEVIRPYPKAGPRKTITKGRKKGSTKILTDTPEKIAIENESREREQKKMMKLAVSAKRNLDKKKAKKKPKPKKKRSNIYESSSEDEEFVVPPSPESDFCMSDLDDENEESENECVDEDNIYEGDWVVVNLVSEKKMLHRYVGQITNESLASYDVKFAKKVTDTKFKWPEKPDISIIGKYQVVKKISPPIFKSSSKRVGPFQFSKSLRKFNIDK